jgi:hypothetical protein
MSKVKHEFEHSKAELTALNEKYSHLVHSSKEAEDNPKTSSVDNLLKAEDIRVAFRSGTVRREEF